MVFGMYLYDFYVCGSPLIGIFQARRGSQFVCGRVTCAYWWFKCNRCVKLRMRILSHRRCNICLLLLAYFAKIFTVSSGKSPPESVRKSPSTSPFTSWSMSLVNFVAIQMLLIRSLLNA